MFNEYKIIHCKKSVLKIQESIHEGVNLKGIVSRDWKGLQMVSFDRFEV
jgi:hypothetical protein